MKFKILKTNITETRKNKLVKIFILFPSLLPRINFFSSFYNNKQLELYNITKQPEK